MPQVYLPPGYSAESAGGNITGTDVALNFGNSILNTGSIAASNTLTVTTPTLTNQQNLTNVGQIWSNIQGAGYSDTTGTDAQPGGFMSAANIDLNVQTVDQIGGALQQLTSTGAVSSTGTQQLLSSLQAQLGSSFTQSTVASNLNTSFTAEGGGFDPSMMVVAMMAVMISAVTAGAASAAIGSALSTGVSSTFAAAVQASAGVVGTSAGLGNIALSAAIGSMVGSSASQLMTSGTLNFGQVLDTGLVSGLTAGLTDGITYSSTNGVGFTADPIVDGSGVQTLASLAGVQMTASTLVPQAGVVAGSVPQEILALGTDASIQAGVQTAIEGGSFLNNLKTAGVQDLAAVGAYTIGNLAPTLATDLGPVGGELATITAHAALGCAASAAEGTGCAGGAIGAAASSAFTSLIPNPTDSNGNATSFTTGEVAGLTATSTLLGAVAAGLAGANPLGGAAAAENETLNNRLLHPEEQQAINQLANGDPVAAQNLQAAACALVNCAAQFAPGTQQYNFYTALDAQGSNLTTEQAELLNYDEPSYSSALN